MSVSYQLLLNMRVIQYDIVSFSKQKNATFILSTMCVIYTYLFVDTTHTS